MKKLYKPLFWSLLVLFVLTNLFWFYQVLDSAIGRSYYEVTCEELRKDSNNLKKLTTEIKTKKEILNFVKSYNLKIDTLQKGELFYINFGSFDIGFDQNGNRFQE